MAGAHKVGASYSGLYEEGEDEHINSYGYKRMRSFIGCSFTSAAINASCLQWLARSAT